MWLPATHQVQSGCVRWFVIWYSETLSFCGVASGNPSGAIGLCSVIRYLILRNAVLLTVWLPATHRVPSGCVRWFVIWHSGNAVLLTVWLPATHRVPSGCVRWFIILRNLRNAGVLPAFWRMESLDHTKWFPTKQALAKHAGWLCYGRLSSIYGQSLVGSPLISIDSNSARHPTTAPNTLPQKTIQVRCG